MNINSFRIEFRIETKIDDSFPVGNFLMYGFSSPYRLDQDSMGSSILLYVREDITSKLLSTEAKQIEEFYVELTLRNYKSLINHDRKLSSSAY